MATYRLVNCINLSKCAVKNRHLTSLFVCDRHFCSKDNKNDKLSSKDRPSKDQEEKDNEETMKVDKSSIKAIIPEDAKKAAAKEKLMSLLSSIKIEAEPVKRTSNINLAKPHKRISRKERLRKMQDELITPEKEMDMAVKAVASSFKEESEKVETELTAKLSTLKLSKKEEAIDGDANIENANIEDVNFKDVNFEDSELNNEMNEKLMTSVKQVAETISENPILPRSELAKRLMQLSVDQEHASEKKSVRAVIEGMAIEQKPVSPPPPPPPKRERRKAPKTIRKINLFGSPPLNIFTPDAEAKTNSTNDFWQELQKRELRLLTQFAPANAFEEMIMWTEQGKHWKLPIDNEIDMQEEEKFGFHEHVFLERHLEGFPTKGPIRHFMELVAVGLSKNPYITVDRKLENIEWFRNYFKEKEELLREEGVLD